MREIKFRAWDLEKKEFHYYNGIFNVQPYTEQNKGFALQYDGSSPKYHECIVEEFTGLKDKNGKEIYEGDILSKDGESEEDRLTWVVEYKITPYNSFYDFGYMSRIDLCEIIGNIHENKELLEEA